MNNNNNNRMEIENEENANNQFESKINEIYNKIFNMITQEKNKIKSKKESLQKICNDFSLYKKQEIESLEEEKKNLKGLYKFFNKVKENDIIDLNIGGTHEITTTRNTLIKYKNSILAALFSGENKLPLYKNGKIFIDRDGESFVNLVNFLRTGKYPVFKEQIEENKFFDELNYWKIPIISGSKNIK